MKNSRTYTITAQSVLLVLSALYVYPLALMLIKSFDVSGVQNYVRVFEKVNLLPNFQTSLIVVGGTLLIVSVVTSLAAFAFSKVPFAGSGTLYYLLLMGMMVPTAATIFPLFQIVKGMKLNNTPFALILPYATANAIFNLMVLKNFYDGLPNELIEAATIDGANLFRIFLAIMMPISLPGLAIVLVQTFLNSWNELQMAMIFINKTALQPLSVVPLRFQQQRSGGFPVEVMYACLVVCLAPIAVFYLFAQRFLIAGLTAGAVKG
jgi:raffinose/stachyose/melibiose transport system permease protein